MYVSLIGSDQKRVREIGEEVEREIMGNMVTEEEVVRKKECAGVGVETGKNNEMVGKFKL